MIYRKNSVESSGKTLPFLAFVFHREQLDATGASSKPEASRTTGSISSFARCSCLGRSSLYRCTSRRVPFLFLSPLLFFFLSSFLFFFHHPILSHPFEKLFLLDVAKTFKSLPRFPGSFLKIHPLAVWRERIQRWISGSPWNELNA